jgi:hypothetical protein
LVTVCTALFAKKRCLALLQENPSVTLEEYFKAWSINEHRLKIQGRG